MMMAWLRIASLVLLLSFLRAIVSAQELEDAAAFERKWVVVLGSYPQLAAARRASAVRGGGLHILASDAFSGFTPGYHVLVAGPFEDRNEANLAAGVVAQAERGYVKFTGALRTDAPATQAAVAHAAPVIPAPPAAEPTPESRPGGAPIIQAAPAFQPPAPVQSAAPVAQPATPSPLSAAPAARKPGASARAFPVPDFMSEEQAGALERWRRAAERSAGPGAQYHILQIFESFAGAAGALLIRERVVTTERCLQGYRELEFGAPQAGIELHTAAMLGRNCCPGTPCSERSPGGVMLELFEGARDHSWAIDPVRGVAVDNMQGWSKHIGREQAKDLDEFTAFDPTHDSFECPQFWLDGSAHCFKYADGKGYDFVWAKRGSSAVLERIVIAHRQ